MSDNLVSVAEEMTKKILELDVIAEKFAKGLESPSFPIPYKDLLQIGRAGDYLTDLTDGGYAGGWFEGGKCDEYYSKPNSAIFNLVIIRRVIPEWTEVGYRNKAVLGRRDGEVVTYDNKEQVILYRWHGNAVLTSTEYVLPNY